MGYTHLTDIAQFISPSMIGKSAGTWTPSFSGNLAGEAKSAAADSFVLHVPLALFGSNIGLQGARVKSIKYWYSIAVADLTNFNTVSVVKSTLKANGAACTGTAVAVTVGADNDSSVKRITQASHTLEVTLNTPQFIKDNEALFLILGATAAASSAYSHFGACVYFDLRI